MSNQVKPLECEWDYTPGGLSRHQAYTTKLPGMNKVCSQI